MGRAQRWTRLAFCALALAPNLGRAETATEVHAEIFWTGPCEDPAQLAAELRERGMALDATWNRESTGAAIRLSVAAHPQGPNANVVAELQLSNALGQTESRIVEVTHCGLLQPALALILSSFAERESQGPSRAPGRVSRAPERVIPPSQSVTPRPLGASTRLRLERFTPRRTVPKQPSEFGELRFSSHALSGVGWVGSSLSLGVGVQLEWQPARAWPVRVAAGFAYLPTPSSQQSETDVAWSRRFGRIVGTLQTPLRPLQLSLGAEWGVTRASAPDLLNAQTGRATWYALTAMPRVDLNLVEELLFLQMASGLSYVPVRYTLRFADTDRVFERSSQLEWRAELAIAVRLSSSIP